MTRALLLVLALGAFGAEAAAAKKGPPLAELKKEFAAGEFERVIKRAEAALKGGLQGEEAAQVQLWRAQALLALGREEPARAAFTRAVEAWSEIALDAERASPDAVRLFEKARDAVPATLAVTVLGGEATVLIDEKDLGPAPLVTQLPGGPHVVEARGAGGLVAKEELELKAARRQELTLTLQLPPPPAEPKPEPVAVAPPPAEAQPPVAAPVAVEQPPPAPSSPSRVGLIPLIGGVALGAAGGVLLWQARAAYDTLNGDGPALTAEQEAAALRDGPMFQSLGWVAVGVGAAAVVAGVVMLAIAPASPAQAGVFVVPGGGGVTVSASLP